MIFYDDEPTMEQLEARRQFAPTNVKVEPVTMMTYDHLHVRCGDFVFVIHNHQYAVKLGQMENERLKAFMLCEAHRIANWLERMKREVNP